jgi:hypothetical protein
MGFLVVPEPEGLTVLGIDTIGVELDLREVRDVVVVLCFDGAEGELEITGIFTVADVDLGFLIEVMVELRDTVTLFVPEDVHSVEFGFPVETTVGSCDAVGL